MFVNEAWAQAGAPAGAANPILVFLVQFGPILLMLGIMYFLLLYPQQQRQKKLDAQIKALKRGDKVVTSGGILGTVQDIDDQKIVLKVGGDVKIEFVRSAVVQVLGAEAK